MNGNMKVTEVKHTSGDSRSFLLDIDENLECTRASLAEFMKKDDLFLFKLESPVDRKSEKDIKLSQIRQEKDEAILIGQVKDTLPSPKNDNIDRYNQLDLSRKKRLFQNLEIFRGYTFTQKGFYKTFHDVYAWEEGYTPTANHPQVNTEKITSCSFSQFTRDLTVSGIQSASVSLSTPFVSGEAEYNHEKSKSTHDNKVEEYLVSRFIVRNIVLQIDQEKIYPLRDFCDAVSKAVKYDKSPTSDNYLKLIEVLDEWGYYIPIEFTLGGLIYSTESTKIDEFKQSETEREEFSVSFQAQIKGIGGGAAIKNSQGKESMVEKSTKYQNTVLQARGGAAMWLDDQKDYTKWVDSLDNAINWVVIEHAKLYPTLALLNKPKPKGNPMALGDAIKCIEYHVSRNKKTDKYLDIEKYGTVVQELVTPYS